MAGCRGVTAQPGSPDARDADQPQQEPDVEQLRARRRGRGRVRRRVRDEAEAREEAAVLEQTAAETAAEPHGDRPGFDLFTPAHAPGTVAAARRARQGLRRPDGVPRLAGPPHAGVAAHDRRRAGARSRSTRPATKRSSARCATSRSGPGGALLPPTSSSPAQGERPGAGARAARRRRRGRGSTSRTAAGVVLEQETTGSSRARSTAAGRARRPSRCPPTCRWAGTGCAPGTSEGERRAPARRHPRDARAAGRRCSERPRLGLHDPAVLGALAVLLGHR